VQWESRVRIAADVTEIQEPQQQVAGVVQVVTAPGDKALQQNEYKLKRQNAAKRIDNGLHKGNGFFTLKYSFNA
jgi:hypothetical protein